FFSSRRRHTRFSRDWSSDVCSSDLGAYRWLHGRVHFTPDEPRPIEGLEVEVRLMDVHREANGRAREWEAIAAALPSLDVVLRPRSEERRVGKECRARGEGEA